MGDSSYDWPCCGRLGVMGGTFDPIHNGHLRMAEEFAERYRLDQVLLIPCGLPVHKQTPEVDPNARLKMISLACELSPYLSASDIELKAVHRGEKNYTINTLETLHQQLNNDAKVYFLMGSDSYAGLSDWERAKDILSLADIVVVKRARDSQGSSNQIQWLRDYEKLGRVHLEDFSYLDISSTDIRERLSRQQTIRFLVPTQVEQFILDNQLYRNYD